MNKSHISILGGKGSRLARKGSVGSMSNRSDVPMPLPVAPSVEAWAAMSPDEREAFIQTANEALSDPLRTMAEGRPHKLAKLRASQLLERHFREQGRHVYVAEEMSVVYPSEEVFTPDVLAVLDVEQRDDDERMGWVVMDEGRGIDFVLEVLHRGDRKKDLVLNVERYARLGIREYFVYDFGKQLLHGFRLVAGTGVYGQVEPRDDRWYSEVLELELALEGGALRFYQGPSELLGTHERLERLGDMVERAEAEAERTLASLRGRVLAQLARRGLPCGERDRERVLACRDAELLLQWLERAYTAPLGDVLAAKPSLTALRASS